MSDTSQTAMSDTSQTTKLVVAIVLTGTVSLGSAGASFAEELKVSALSQAGEPVTEARRGKVCPVEMLEAQLHVHASNAIEISGAGVNLGNEGTRFTA